jgi:hypothetical protein
LFGVQTRLHKPLVDLRQSWRYRNPRT